MKEKDGGIKDKKEKGKYKETKATLTTRKRKIKTGTGNWKTVTMKRRHCQRKTEREKRGVKKKEEKRTKG